eukprot:TRINITY_DN48947_c0_g1_i1.p1 TRINITY_DN48947_c0_g1~~TRINITY_DN48947_c0_g1_i1.p1  ORF type:complete len:303 (-),score=7.55 TRINITY_DN48947_c0_g1_i1:436-1266(-)
MGVQRLFLSGVSLVVLGLAVSVGVLQSSPTLRRRWFAWFLPVLKGRHDPAVESFICDHIKDVKGVVFEIGPGTGDNLRCLRGNRDVKRWVGVEPNPHFRDAILARKAEYDLPFPIEVVTAGAEDHDAIIRALPDGSADAAISVHVLCSIPRGIVPAALRNVAKALRDGGEYRFIDHVQDEHFDHPLTLASLLPQSVLHYGRSLFEAIPRPSVALGQRIIAPLQYVIADGCEYRPVWETISRDALRPLGFRDAVYTNVSAPIPMAILRPHLVGHATK